MLHKLQLLDLSQNIFYGNIPSSLGNLTSLTILNLGWNNLQGSIPLSLSQCQNLIRLYLNNNNLSGTITSEVITLSFSLNTLNLAANQFSSVLSIEVGNLKNLEKLDVSKNMMFGATNGFSSTNLIGVGSFGSIYKGILDQGRHTVAIKVLNLLHHRASKSFMAKCETLRNIKHQNLVKVLTTCSGIDYQGHEFKALVYELLGNGNLDEWLHPTPRTDEAALEEPRKLSLLQRLNITFDVASALDYLHHHCETPIVHCDLKPSNVLLDDNIIGHVGNFDLARFLHDGAQDCSTNQSSSIGEEQLVTLLQVNIFYISQKKKKKISFSHSFLLLLQA